MGEYVFNLHATTGLAPRASSSYVIDADVAVVFSDGRLNSLSVAPDATVVESMPVTLSTSLVDPELPIPPSPQAAASNAPINPIADINERDRSEVLRIYIFLQ